MKTVEACACAAEIVKAELDGKTVDLTRRFNCLLERSPLPMFIVEGAERRVSYVNPSFCYLIGKASQATMKVLYTSGYTDDPEVHQRILEPGSVLLQKPFLPLALIEKAHEVLSDE